MLMALCATAAGLTAWLAPRLAADPAGIVWALPLWGCLLWAAWVDARTGLVPDRILLGGALGALAGLVWGYGLAPAWHAAGLRWDAIPWLAGGVAILLRLGTALAGGGLIWAINEAWFRWRGQDALGMGDAKWSMLAIVGFGALPVLWAWPLAAWLGLLALGWHRLRGQPCERLYFAPFLLAGLLLAKIFLPV
jgi:hypothetical protein